MASDMIAGAGGGTREDESNQPTEGNESDGNRLTYDRTGTEGTCDGWKFAYCDAIAACDAFESREQCEVKIGHLACRDDAPVESCAADINAAVEAEQCDQLPVECAPVQIADQTSVLLICEEIHRAQCEFNTFCGLEFDIETCLENAAQIEPCEQFTAALPAAFDCPDAFARLACDSGAPATCVSVLVR